MNTQERLEFIINNSSDLGSKDFTTILRLYRKLKAKSEANKEENEILGDALYSHSELIRRRLDLADLYQLLADYLGDKGLRLSLLKSEELLSMINSDIRLTEENIEATKESIEGVKKLLKNI